METPDDEWLIEAACYGLPQEWFYPEKREEWKADAEAFAAAGIILKPPVTNDRRAKKVCAGCPVALPCLHSSIVNVERHGVWATGDQARRHLRRMWLASKVDPTKKGAYLDALEQAVDAMRGVDVRPETERQSCARCVASGIPMGYIPKGRHPVDLNGPDAKCGYPVTYARGCRCWHCKLARTQRPFKARLAEVRAADPETTTTEASWQTKEMEAIAV